MKNLLALLVVLVIAFIAWIFLSDRSSGIPTVSGEPIATVQYACDSGENLIATYYQGDATPPANPGEPPQPGGSVALTLGDGRTMTLAQTISASGVRYANADESFVFWNKGRGATVTEGDQPVYACIEVASDPGGLPEVYENGSGGFSIRYPANYTVDDSYRYQGLGPGKGIDGVKFTVDPAVATGTNLASDTYVSVEELPDTTHCDAGAFLDHGDSRDVTDGDTEYSMASTTGAGAGNRYEETVYAISGTNPCIAVRYFIHYGVIENYPEGAVKEFDKAALKEQFEAIRRTLIIR